MMREVGFIDSEFWFNPQVRTLPLVTQCPSQTTAKKAQLPVKTLMQHHTATGLMLSNFHWEDNHVTYSYS